MKQKRLIIEPLPFHRRMSGVGGNRTSDTRIFSPLLYQLSYLATETAASDWNVVGGAGLEPATSCV